MPHTVDSLSPSPHLTLFSSSSIKGQLVNILLACFVFDSSVRSCTNTRVRTSPNISHVTEAEQRPPLCCADSLSSEVWQSDEYTESNQMTCYLALQHVECRWSPVPSPNLQSSPQTSPRRQSATLLAAKRRRVAVESGVCCSPRRRPSSWSVASGSSGTCLPRRGSTWPG